MKELKVELNQKYVDVIGKAKGSVLAGGKITITPPIDKDYWVFRVQLTRKQAVVAFPKFFTMGIGFAVEEADWNVNLPYDCTSLEIYRHIRDNKGDSHISIKQVVEAIELLQAAIRDNLTKDEIEALQY